MKALDKKQKLGGFILFIFAKLKTLKFKKISIYKKKTVHL